MRLCALLFVSLFGAACGGPTVGTCSTTSCTGCCDATGQCQPGTSPAACGALGNSCTTCAVCQLGQCFSGPGGGTGGSGGGGTTGGGGGGGTCRPDTCVGLGLNCGEADDGCGGQLSCGTCDVSGEACGAGGTANVCAPGTCTPGTCTSLGKDCGQVSDGCGSLLVCGVCTGTERCGGGGTPNVCATPLCTPSTCSQLGKNCGVVSDGCTGQLTCGTCSGGQTCGGGGSPNVCGTGNCTATTCAAQGKNCGALSDGCGASLDCGSCSGVQSCGGSGTTNVCGAACPASCPSGFTCAPGSGVCSGGNLQAVTLEVPVAPQLAVSGTVTVNGLAVQLDPVGGFCTGNVAALTFTHASDARFNASTFVSCTGYAWALSLYPGTYRVTVGPDLDATTLPSWSTTVDPAFVVTAARSNVVLDVPVPPQLAVSGTVTVNQMPVMLDPVGGFCTGNVAALTFTHASDARFNASTFVSCTGYAWALALYPGTYRVTVGADLDATTLPSWSTIVDPAFVVTAARSNVVFDVPVPPQHAVSGSVTVNGMPVQLDPVGGFCTGNVAALTFTHASDARFNASTFVSCTGYAWALSLYPGTYRVTVGPDLDATTLPDWSTTIDPAFVVTAARNGVVLDVPVPPQLAVSGTITVNQMPVMLDPVGGFCTGNVAALTFTHASDARFNASTFVSCTGYAWALSLYPGTYRVTVGADLDATTLPSWSTIVDPAFVVTAARSGVVFDVPVPPPLAVSGTVTVNQMPVMLDPVGGFCTGNVAALTFTHASDARFNASTFVSCTGYAWALSLYPGTYRVTVGADLDATTLPSWSTTVDPAFVVTAARNGVGFDVLVPATTVVSGTVTVNGMAPQLDPVGGFCTGNVAALTFTHLTDSRFSASTFVSCTGYAWTLSLYPGTYRVTLGPDLDATTLPSWSTVVVERLLVP